jgi:hypothetical protein
MLSFNVRSFLSYNQCDVKNKNIIMTNFLLQQHDDVR